jgi:RNA polymerase sigma-70 factor (ECF subfamily)
MNNTAHTISDDKVVGRVMAGEVNAFEYLLTKYKDHVLMIVSRHLPYQQVEEMAHEVFIRAYQSIASYKKDDNFKQWLSTISVRTCHDFWRKHYRSHEVPVSALSENHQEWLQQVVSEESINAVYAKGRQQEAREVLDWALAQLTPDDRMVVELVHLEELSNKEAAEILGISIANVKIRSFRARNKLKKLLAGFMQS